MPCTPYPRSDCTHNNSLATQLAVLRDNVWLVYHSLQLVTCNYDMAGNFWGSQFSQFMWLTGDLRKLNPQNRKPKRTFSQRQHACAHAIIGAWPSWCMPLLDRSNSWFTLHQFIIVELLLHNCLCYVISNLLARLPNFLIHAVLCLRKCHHHL